MRCSINRLAIRSLTADVLGLTVVLAACGSDGTGPTSDVPPLEDRPYAIPPERTAWLSEEVTPIDGTHLSLPHDDLEVLRQVIGDARVVALGENTHGTRDFFEMKARILRFLVEEMEFDAFAIEATWPESNRLDKYVRTGEGNSLQLLTGLYFWTWRTEAVLEMIEWMRQHNASGGNVGFYGFDMQYPGMAIWNVEQFVAEVDPDASDEFAELFSCLAPYVNGPQGYRSADERLGYLDLPQETRDACHANLLLVGARLDHGRHAYIDASSDGEFDLAARSARVVAQYEEMISNRVARDMSMADNAIWLLDQLGPDAKIVHWAHNFHVSNQPSSMGGRLRAEYGDDLVIVAFTHSSGSFTAVAQSGEAFSGLSAHVLDETWRDSYESHFSSVQLPRFLLDLRDRGYATDGDAWMGVTRRTRSIGCCYDSGRASEYWFPMSLPSLYDVVIHIENTRATTVLPAEWPDTF